jgi:hypothetical protein
MPKRKLQKIPIYDPENTREEVVLLPLDLSQEANRLKFEPLDGEDLAFEEEAVLSPLDSAEKDRVEFEPLDEGDIAFDEEGEETLSVPQLKQAKNKKASSPEELRKQARHWLYLAKKWKKSWPNYAQIDKFLDCCRRGGLKLEKDFGVTLKELNILRFKSYKFDAEHYYGGNWHPLHLDLFNKWRKSNNIDLKDLGATETDIETISNGGRIIKSNAPIAEKTQETTGLNKPTRTTAPKKNAYELAAVEAHNASVILKIAGEIKRRKGYATMPDIQHELLARGNFELPCKPDARSQKNAARRAIAAALKFTNQNKLG